MLEMAVPNPSHDRFCLKKVVPKRPTPGQARSPTNIYGLGYMAANHDGRSFGSQPTSQPAIHPASHQLATSPACRPASPLAIRE